LIDKDLLSIGSNELSSSLLRICSYPHESKNESSSLAFGSHTDTSFLTICPISSNPGLEVYDYIDSKWKCIEEEHWTDTSVIVMAGEFLQMILKQHFTACIHRVRAPHAGVRYSCPLIMRGRPTALISPSQEKYKHKIETEDIRRCVADLDGVSMNDVHLLLDLKRQKCSREHRDSDEEDWILSSFPTKITL
jgi:isopenicillin N synthase-like dioxygenase